MTERERRVTVVALSFSSSHQEEEVEHHNDDDDDEETRCYIHTSITPIISFVFFCFIVHLKEDRSYRGNASDCSKYEDEEESENNVDKESKNNEDDNGIKELFLHNGSSFVFPKIFFF